MPGIQTPITDREKAAILAIYSGIIPDWKTAYITAEDKPAADVKPIGLNTLVSRWKHSEKVQKFLQYLTEREVEKNIEARERWTEEERTKGQPETAGESESTKGRKAAAVDYSDPKQRKKLYNLIIQEASDDPKTQLDAAKLIEQTQRDDRQAARDNKIQRFFVPVSCKICPFYEKRRVKNPKKL